MEIRTAQPDELAVVGELWEQFEHEIPDPVGEQPVWRDVAEQAHAALVERSVLLATVDGEPVAFAWFTSPQRGVARLEYLYVRPAHRRGGIARRLVDAVAAEVRPRGATHLVLEVVATNDAARATWEALGFELIEYRLAATI